MKWLFFLMIDYEKFVTELKQPSGSQLRTGFQDFLVSFNSGPRVLAYQRKQVSAFLQQMNIASPPLFPSLDPENIWEGWEKLVMSQIFPKVFMGAGDEPKANLAVTKKMEQFHWVQESHLDLKINFELNLEIASAELLRINGYKAPRDKLVIMINVIQLVTGIGNNNIADLIKKCSDENTIANQDTILPTLILVIIRANAANMVRFTNF
jgi:hypothetical protein